MAEVETQKSESVTKSIKAKKLKIDNRKIAIFNAFATSFAIFFGTILLFNIMTLIFDAVTGARLQFSVPFMSIFVGWDVAYGLPSTLLFAGMALACGIFSVVSMSKNTNAEAIGKTWKYNLFIFAALTVLYVLSAILVCFYSFLTIGKGAGPFQLSLWLSGFLPTVVTGCIAAFIVMMSWSIVKGKTKFTNIMNIIAVSVSALAFLIIAIAMTIAFHSSSSSAIYNLFY